MSENILITLERYDQLIAERAVYKNEVQRLKDDIEFKAQLTDSKERLPVHKDVDLIDDDGELFDDDEFASDEQASVSSAQMLNIANHLTKKLIFSDIEGEVRLGILTDGEIKIKFCHFDERYISGVKNKSLYSFYSGKEINEMMSLINSVIAGEALLDE